MYSILTYESSYPTVIQNVKDPKLLKMLAKKWHPAQPTKIIISLTHLLDSISINSQ